jgi:hypothetical protein
VVENKLMEPKILPKGPNIQIPYYLKVLIYELTFINFTHCNKGNNHLKSVQKLRDAVLKVFFI